jgi:hypothetical protein
VWGARVALAVAGLLAACSDTHVIAQLAPAPEDCSFDDAIEVVHGRLDLELAERYRGILRVDGDLSSPRVELRDVAGFSIDLGLPNPFFAEMTRTGNRAELDLVPPLYAEGLSAMGGDFEIVAAVTFPEASWSWPIEVCHGCLVQCGDAPTDLGCLPGQDLPALVQRDDLGFEGLCSAR